MANKTTNFNLTKPSVDDFYDIDVHNGNMDIVDAELKKLNDGKAPSGHGLGDISEGIKNISFMESMKKGCGFHQVGDVSDAPEGLDAWLGLIQAVRSKSEGEETGTQLAFYDFTPNNPRMWLRTLLGGVAGNWVEMLHTGNIAKLTPFKIKSGTYVGNGNYSSSNPSTLTFDADFKPQIVLLLGDGTEDTKLYFCARPRKQGYCMYTDGTSTNRIGLTWGENSISWSGNNASNQNNSSGVTYYYIAIG